MLKHTVALGCVAALAATLASSPASAQPAASGVAMRTPDGQLDVSGMFTFRTLTPLERPQEFEGVDQLSAEDAAAFESAERARRNRDLFDPEKGALFYAPRSEGGVLSYNEFWYERGVELTSDKRTSLIVAPPEWATAASYGSLTRRGARTGRVSSGAHVRLV